MAVAVAVTALWLLWWRQPGSNWACRGETGDGTCVGQVVLQPPDRVPGSPRPAMWGIDISHDGATAVVGLNAGDDGPGSTESLVAVFDAATGEPIVEVLRYSFDGSEPDEQRVGGIDTVAFSPDGSLVVVGRAAIDPRTGKAHREAGVFDAVSGEVVTDFFPTGGGPTSAIGLSADNRLLQVAGTIYDLATGTATPGTVAYDLTTDTSVGEVTLRPLTDLGRVCSRHRVCEGRSAGYEFVDGNAGHDDPGRVILDLASGQVPGSFEGFGPSGSGLLFVESHHHSWLDRLSPERVEPGATFSVVDLHGGESIATFDTGPSSLDVGRDVQWAWSEGGTHLALLYDDLTLTRFRLSEPG